MKFNSILYNAAVDLNDAAPGHEFTTWSQEQLRAYVVEALQLAFIVRPDLFTETRIIKLQPCTIVHDACDCTNIRRVFGQCTADGRIINMLRPKKQQDNLIWTGRTCPVSPKNFKLTQYAIDADTNKLWVWPQVPAGLDVYLLVECDVLPDEFTDDYEVSSELQAAVMQWVLYRAKMVDGENNTAIIQVATTHRETFWQILQAQANAEEVDVANKQATTTGVNPYAQRASGLRVVS